MSCSQSFIADNTQSVLSSSFVSQDKATHQIVRIAGDSGSEVWSFWVDVATQLDAEWLSIELAVSFWERYSPEIQQFIRDVMPAWTTLLAGTTYLSSWNFSSESAPQHFPSDAGFVLGS